MDDSNLSCELCQVHSFLNGRIAAAYYIHFKVLEEVGVTGSAEGNSLAHELAFSLASDGTRESACGDDQCLTLICIFGSVKLLYGAFQLDLCNGIACALSTELFSLCCHSGDQGRAALAFYHLAGIVFNFVSNSNLAAIFCLLDNKSRQAVSSGVQAGS